MFGRRFWGARFFGPRYWGEGENAENVAPRTSNLFVVDPEVRIYVVNPP